MMLLKVVKSPLLEDFKHGLYNHLTEAKKNYRYRFSYKNKRPLRSLLALSVYDSKATTPFLLCNGKYKGVSLSHFPPNDSMHTPVPAAISSQH